LIQLVFNCKFLNYPSLFLTHTCSANANANATDPLLQYLQAFYAVTKAMAMVGPCPRPLTAPDHLFCIAQLLFALLLFAIVMGYAAHIISNLEGPRKKFQGKPIDGPGPSILVERSCR
jgi:hypothetical protein